MMMIGTTTKRGGSSEFLGDNFEFSDVFCLLDGIIYDWISFGVRRL